MHPCRQHHRQRDPSLHHDARRHGQIKAVIQHAQHHQRRDAQQVDRAVGQPGGLPQRHQRQRQVYGDAADQRNMPQMLLARIGLIH